MVNDNKRTNACIIAVIGVMLLAMIHDVIILYKAAIMKSGQADDAAPRLYVKVYAKKALFEEGLGKTDVFGPGGMNPTQPVYFTFLFFTETKVFNSPTNTVPGLN
ncbi:MAG TPA: hypothetical protein VLA68_05700 [Nitrososphaera sp.]|nr:hypothetical protein [Nitrososphaera sp.]